MQILTKWQRRLWWTHFTLCNFLLISSFNADTWISVKSCKLWLLPSPLHQLLPRQHCFSSRSVSHCGISKVLVPANVRFQGLRAQTALDLLQRFCEIWQFDISHLNRKWKTSRSQVVYVLRFIQDVLQHSLLFNKTHSTSAATWCKNSFFYSESSNSPQQSLKNVVVFIAGGFEDMTGQGAKSSHLSSLCYKRVDKVIFQGPFQTRVFYCSRTWCKSLINLRLPICTIFNKLTLANSKTCFVT